MDIHEIMRMLPHRYPFLLVDRVVQCIPGREIRGYKNVARNELHAIASEDKMPAFLVLEALAQVAVILTFRSLELTPTGDELIFFAGIDNARFMGSVEAGDQLCLECSIIRLMPKRGIGKFRVVARVGPTVVASAEMMAALQLSK